MLKYLQFAFVLVLFVSCTDNSKTTKPLKEEALKRDPDSHFEIQDFGGGGHCFFYSVAGILGSRDQQSIRSQMAKYVRNAAYQQKEKWLSLIQIYKRDPLMARHYEGVNSIEDLALRLENKPPFQGVYEGDQLSIGIAEESFDLTLAIIDDIKPIAADNHFKQGPGDNRLRRRLAFLRQVGGDASGHFQVHKYVDPKTKRASLIFDLDDPESVPWVVRDLIGRYEVQYNVFSSHIKVCRPSLNVCSRFDANEAACKALEINQVKYCIWTAPSPARCEGIAGCSIAFDQEQCESIFDKTGHPLCHFETSINGCQELRGSGIELGCRALRNPTQASCTALEVRSNGAIIANFCTFESAAPSTCTGTLSANPCSNRCGKDSNCEER